MPTPDPPAHDPTSMEQAAEQAAAARAASPARKAAVVPPLTVVPPSEQPPATAAAVAQSQLAETQPKEIAAEVMAAPTEAMETAAASPDAAAAELNTNGAAAAAVTAVASVEGEPAGTTPMQETADGAPVSTEEKQSEPPPQQPPSASEPEPGHASLALDHAIAATTLDASNEAKAEEDTEMEVAPAATIVPPVPDQPTESTEPHPPLAVAAAPAVPSEVTSDARMADPASEAQTEALEASAIADSADLEPPASFPFPSLGSPSPSGNPPAAVATVETATATACVVQPTETQQPIAPLPRFEADSAVLAPAMVAAAAASPPMPSLESVLHPPSSLRAQATQPYATLIRVKLEGEIAPAAAIPDDTPMETAQQTPPTAVPAEPATSRKRRNSDAAGQLSSTAAAAASAAAGAVAAAAPASAPRTPSKPQSKHKSNGAVDLSDADDASKGARKRKKTAAKSHVDIAASDKENSHSALVASFARPGSAAATAAAAVLAASSALDFETLSQTEEASRSRQHAAEQLRQHNATLASAQAEAARAGLSVSGQQPPGNDCIICQTTYTSHGNHRVCCLKCGHLFGRKCVEHWLSKSKSCPTCKKPALKSDIRNLYAPSSGVVVADSTHLQGWEDKLQQAKTELTKQTLINAKLTDELKKLQVRYESIVVAHQSLQRRVMRSNGTKTGETQLTYILSPTVQPAGAAPEPASRPLSPSQFHPITLPQYAQQTPASPATMLNNLQAAVTRAATVPPSGHHLPAHLPSHPPSHSFGASPTRPSTAQDMSRSQSHATASSAAFLHPPQTAVGAASASSSAPLLPAMPSKPPLRVGSNEMQFPLMQLFTVEGGRVMDFDNANTNLLLSACPPQYASTVANGLTYGVMKLSVSDVSCRYFMPLHSKPIRELKYDARQQLLLSASFDKTLKLSNVAHGSIVAAWELPQPAWSATFNSWNDSYVHVGLQTGELLTFDIRMNQTVPLFSLQLPSKQPVHSLFSMGNPSDPEDGMRGLIAGTTAHVSFWKSSSNLKHWDLHDLPLIPTPRTASGGPPGPSCSSVAFDAISSSVLCSLRPPSVPVPAPASLPGANGYTLAKPQSPPMCTVFQLGTEQNAAVAPPSATGRAASASASTTVAPPKVNARFTVHVPASNRVAFEVSRVPVPATDVSCSCTAQLTGHRTAASLTRSTIFTPPAARGSSRFLVAIGDDDSDQCIVWDATTERVLSRLTGQPSPITQVHYSPTLNLMASLSNTTCCLYSTATAGQ